MHVRYKSKRDKYKCEACNTRFPTLSLLNAHKAKVHLVNKKIKKILRSKQNKGKRLRAPNDAAKYLDKNKSLLDTKKEIADKIGKQEEPSMDALLPRNQKMVYFQCPKCEKLFETSFTATRHIQKYCASGDKSHPDSKDTSKPIRLERCSKCDSMIQSNEEHECVNVEGKGPVMKYKCTGCSTEYDEMGLQIIKTHAQHKHATNTDSMFFPTISEFETWLKYVEAQTKTSYTKIVISDTKSCYRCNYGKTDVDNNIQSFCPSTILINEYATGFQVYFYKEHYGHANEVYVLSNLFKNYNVKILQGNLEVLNNSIPAVKKDSGDTKDGDLYVQFKDVMESVILNAAKLKIAALRSLMNKALDMASFVIDYDDDEIYESVNLNTTNIVMSSTSANGTLSDVQISEVLDNLKDGLKRKSVNETYTTTNFSESPKSKTVVPTKRPRTRSNVTQVTDKKSEKALIEKDKTVGTGTSHVSVNKLNNDLIASVSVTSSPVTKSVIKTRKSVMNKSEISSAESSTTSSPMRKIKRSMANGTSKSSLLSGKVKKVEKLQKVNSDDSSKSTLSVGNLKSASTKLINVNREQINSSGDNVNLDSGNKSKSTMETSSFNDSYKEFVVKQGVKYSKPLQTHSSNQSKIKRKQIMRTKLGQFSPKSSPAPKAPPKQSKGNIKKQKENNIIENITRDKIEHYELQERDYDCNVLILKI